MGPGHWHLLMPPVQLRREARPGVESASHAALPAFSWFGLGRCKRVSFKPFMGMLTRTYKGRTRPCWNMSVGVPSKLGRYTTAH